MEREIGVHDYVQGGIIALVPTPASQFRLRPRYRRILDRLAESLGKSPREVVEMSVAHLEGTMRNRQPVYPDYPDDDLPRTHKTASGAR